MKPSEFGLLLPSHTETTRLIFDWRKKNEKHVNINKVKVLKDIISKRGLSMISSLKMVRKISSHFLADLICIFNLILTHSKRQSSISSISTFDTHVKKTIISIPFIELSIGFFETKENIWSKEYTTALQFL